MTPKISVIIPCYNQAHYLPDALNSVLNQTYTNWECIIVNDGSVDATQSVALDFCSREPRIRYFYKENGGLSSARNKGLDEASGEFIQFLDSDDLLHPDKFTESLHLLGGADIAMSGFKTFFENGVLNHLPFALYPELFNFHEILTGWDDKFVFPPHAGLYKGLLFKTLRFNENLQAREDWLMWLQIYRQQPVTVFIDRPYALYRSSPNSMSQNKSLMDNSLIEVYKIIFPMLPDNEKENFFDKAMNTFQRLLDESARLTKITRQSKSFRLGNFFIRKLTRLKVISR